MIFGLLNDELDFVLPRLVFLMVIQMAWVVTNLVHRRRDDLRKPEIFLQVNGQIRSRLFADLGECCGVFFAIDRDAYHPRAGRHQSIRLLDRRIDILCFGCCHTLSSNGIVIADDDVPNRNRASGVALNRHGQFGGEIRLLA